MRRDLYIRGREDCVGKAEVEDVLDEVEEEVEVEEVTE